MHWMDFSGIDIWVNFILRHCIHLSDIDIWPYFVVCIVIAMDLEAILLPYCQTAC